MFTLEELNKIYDCLDEYESNLYNGNWDAIKKEIASDDMINDATKIGDKIEVVAQLTSTANTDY